MALIPLASQTEARTAISEARQNQHVQQEDDEATVESESLHDDAGSSLGREEASLNSPTTPPPETEKKDSVEQQHKKTTSVVEDVIGRRGAYGRFAEKWFSRAGWSADKRRTLGMSSQEDVSTKGVVEDSDGSAKNHPETGKAPPLEVIPTEDGETGNYPADDMSMPLLPKMLRTTRLLFSSNSFFYSHDYDLSHSLSKQPNPGSAAPLFKQFDPLVSHHPRLQRDKVRLI